MKFVKNQKGSVIVLVALGITVLIGITALVIDGGSLFLERSRMQKAIDAAVLAGAQELPARPDSAKQTAMDIAEKNGIASSELAISFENGNTIIRASAERTKRLSFAGALGFSSSLVDAVAAVKLQPITSAMGAIPLGVDSSRHLSYGDPVVMKAGEATVGNFGALVLSGPGANLYETDLQNGFTNTLSVGDVLDTQTGNIAGPTVKAIEDRFNECPYDGTAAYYDYPAGCPRVVLVPVYKPITSSNQIKQIQVVGFASFFIESVASTNEGAQIVGRFIQTSYSGDSSSANSDFGTYGYKLIE